MALSEAIVNKIKVLLYEDNKEDARKILVAEAGVSEEEANEYIQRFATSLKKPEISKKSVGKGIQIVVFFVGFVLVGIAVYWVILTNNKIAQSELISGQVIDMVYSEDSSAPVIGYEINGMNYHYVSGIYASPPAYQLNESIEIYVSKDNPNEVMINSFINKWLVAVILGSIGLFLSLIAAILLFTKTTGGPSDMDMFDHDEDRMVSLHDI
jgi:uncharacterized protein DUF3592